MAKLLERTVQEAAQTFLCKRYKRKARKSKVYSKMEARTRKKYGSKRADGILAFHHWIFGPYLVSMEAKSYKTLAAIKPYRNDNKLIKNSVWAGILIGITTGAIFALFKMDDGHYQFLIPLNIIVLGGLLYGLLTLKSSRHKEINVIKQLEQYPANEKWLAFSKDSVMSLDKTHQKKLIKICKRKGIGLLLVSQRKQIKVWVKPKMHWKWFGDYISYYSNEKEIRKAIDVPVF